MNEHVLKIAYFIAVIAVFFAAINLLNFKQGGQQASIIAGSFFPQETSCLTVNDFKRMIGDITGSTSFTYRTSDDKGKSMDTAKVIYSPERDKYLAVYHSAEENFFSVWLAESSDLMVWMQKAKLFDYTERTSQPYIARIGRKYYVAVEKDTGTSSYVLIKRYSDVNALYNNIADKTLSIPLTFSTSNDGTPSITDTGNRILLGFHWNDNTAGADKQAVGYVDYDLNGYSGLKKIEISESSIKSNIGDRDFIIIAGVPMIVLEGNQAYRSDPNFWNYWRIYAGEVRTDLSNINSYSLQQIDVKNNVGQTSFANPSISIVPSPKDKSKNALLVSYFNFGSLGQVIFYYELSCGQTISSSSTTLSSTTTTITTSSSTISTTSSSIETTSSTSSSTTSTATTSYVIVNREIDYSPFFIVGVLIILISAILFVFTRMKKKQKLE